MLKVIQARSHLKLIPNPSSSSWRYLPTKQRSQEDIKMFSDKISQDLSNAVNSLSAEFRQVKEKTAPIERKQEKAFHESRKTRKRVEDLKEKIDRLEMASRRDNLKLFNIPV